MTMYHFTMTASREHLLRGVCVIILWFVMTEGQYEYDIGSRYNDFGKEWCQPQHSKELEECVQRNFYYGLSQVQKSAEGMNPKRRLIRQMSYGYDESSSGTSLRGTLCSLLIRNADLHKEYCQNGKFQYSTEVALRLSWRLRYISLADFTKSELRSAITSIVETVETLLLLKFIRDPQNKNISTSELEINAKVSRDVCGGEVHSLSLTVLGNSMQVPCTHVSGNTSGAILISYKVLESKLSSSLLGALREPEYEEKGEIISSIIGGAIPKPDTENLEPPVTFYLRHLKEVAPFFTVQCVSWDMKQRAWSSRGCETRKSDRENGTLCVCNHLSTFAVLMAPSNIQEDRGLILISRIGLSLSLFCLCVTLLTFILYRTLRNAHSYVLTALCGCLFLGQLLVLVGLHQTGNKVLCAVIASFLQFSFLCAFCWMSLESALLFMTVRNLQAMNYMTSQRSHFPYVCLVGFGIPAIIIILSASIQPKAYGTKKHCWLRLDLIWSFLGPVCVFITINFILLVLTFVILKKKLSSLNANVSTLKNTRLLTFKALSQLFILGCTWIFGLFQFGSGSLVMSYIFTICNSFQGLYIFCVHCLLNRQVREEYMRGFRRFLSKKSDTEVVSGSSVPMMVKSSQT